MADSLIPLFKNSSECLSQVMIVFGFRLARPQVRCYCRRKLFFRTMIDFDPVYRGHSCNPNSLWTHFLNLTGLCCYMGRIPLRRRLKDRLENDPFPSLYVADTGLRDRNGRRIYGLYFNEFVPKTGNKRMNTTKTFNFS